MLVPARLHLLVESVYRPSRLKTPDSRSRSEIWHLRLEIWACAWPSSQSVLDHYLTYLASLALRFSPPLLQIHRRGPPPHQLPQTPLRPVPNPVLASLQRPVRAQAGLSVLLHYSRICRSYPPVLCPSFYHAVGPYVSILSDAIIHTL